MGERVNETQPRLTTRRRRRNAALRALTLGTTLALVAACGGGETEAATSGPRPVVVSAADLATARQDTLRTGPVLAGSLEPATVVRLTAQIGGTVSSLRVDRGTPVRRGQVLAVIEAEGIRGQAAGARASVAAAQANVAVMRQRRDAARQLHEAGATSRLDAEAAQAALDAAEAELAVARAQAAATGEQASRTVIASPITGVVSDRAVEQGEAVASGDPLLTVVNSQRLELSGQIPVDQAAGVRVGQPVEFTLDAYPDRRFSGTVARIDPRADPATRQVGVYVQLPNPGDSIIGGQFARGRVLGEQQEALVVPQSAIRTAGEEQSVLAIVDGKVQRRLVTLGARDTDRGLVEVRSGLQPGDRVLTVPNAQIAEGTAVTIAGEDTPAAVPAGDTAATLRPEGGR
jgi:RND family efflux transporter MFP subunit